MEQAKQWQKPDGTPVVLPIEDEVRTSLVKAKRDGNSVRVCIGTDSQVKGECVHFATVIVFIRKGKGGFMYVLPHLAQRKMSIKERMLEEVQKSIDVACSLSRLFKLYGVELEVHTDINTQPDFKSNAALAAAMGHVRAMGFAFPG